LQGRHRLQESPTKQHQRHCWDHQQRTAIAIEAEKAIERHIALLNEATPLVQQRASSCDLLSTCHLHYSNSRPLEGTVLRGLSQESIHCPCMLQCRRHSSSDSNECTKMELYAPVQTKKPIAMIVLEPTIIDSQQNIDLQKHDRKSQCFRVNACRSINRHWKKASIEVGPAKSAIDEDTIKADGRR
jgi:hypothetical protein